MRDLEAATTCKADVKGQKICARWSGPPHAFIALSTKNSGSEWVRWHVDDEQNIHSVKAQNQRGASAIGALRPLCPGTVAATTAGVSFTGIQNASFDATAAVGSHCGFSVDVTADGTGPKTIALFGSASVPLSVTVQSKSAQSDGVMMTPVVKSLALTTRKQRSSYVDTHVHVTIDGAKGELVRIFWEGNTSSPTRPPSNKIDHFNYTRLTGTKCEVGSCAAGTCHASGRIEGKTPAECMAQCDKDDTCSCVVYDSKTGACDMLTRCLVDKATPVLNSTYGLDTYIKDYTVLQGLNCYDGHGAVDIDVAPAPNLTQERCAERCEAVPACTGAVHTTRGAKKGDCWMRSNIDLRNCAHISFQTMLLKPTMSVASILVPNVALYAATWAPGGPPELPGYEPNSVHR
eukprot:SAG31_NODE_2870_length_4974_cov_1.507282_3_plen_404_part_00